MGGSAHPAALMGRSEDSVQESVLSFHCVGSVDGTRAISLAASPFYPLSHLTSPSLKFSILLLQPPEWLERSWPRCFPIKEDLPVHTSKQCLYCPMFFCFIVLRFVFGLTYVCVCVHM